MIDVANELGLPSYLFNTSAAASLLFMLHLITGHDQVGREFQASDTGLVIPGYVNSVPSNVLYALLFDKIGGCICFLNLVRRFKETKAIITNSFAELESHALDEIMKWLDNQPPSMVVFLCFGSLVPIDEAQAMEIAQKLEKCGHRFLWSVRIQRPISDATSGKPNNYTNLKEMLPQRFLERIKGRGMVCGWAPQVEVLAHKSIGGFVSLCGWNSISESLWYRVPILTWPLYAEQQLNAFQMVKD
ncbi:UDP-glucosyl transferase 71C4, putative [Theobroma cacao]|uniref:UDP-glucosyl transferase 71C4, putative n=1 Tax=Theobroma cacao TaxID=3641 RepID=A0A061DMG7_THECC|nr:UDP-glucosyl transferase 71C4, putative [Theobroma cacao]